MRGRAFLVFLSLILLTACSGDPQRNPHAATSSSAKPKESKGPTRKQPVITPHDKACRGGVPFYAASPPYDGAGTHKMIGFALYDTDDPEVSGPAYPPGLPSSWASSTHDEYGTKPRVFETAPMEADFKQAQLAVCMSWPRLTGKSAVGECGPYEGVTRKVFPADYTFRVFEARTGRLIKSFTLSGADDGCPAQIILGDRKKMPQVVDDEALAAELRPLVKRDF
ncbi:MULTISPECIES: hypothetical protein [unclassified Streptomyces]|uniref:hypothetical protein n=1 Tax=unclassified Streptomyces TaxID=2593676 RepID=UPI002DD9152E|nr:hypothetical protein [Streptomyces sp. NBC_01775]WSB79501.1 hypothetical protein OHB04_29775 [Streptomyces sp. NBC_01775]WSS41007.1 hypothetical protein OG220_10595 [Streptomyces sp. NBC_01187]